MPTTLLLPLLMLGLTTAGNTVAGFIRQDGWPAPLNTVLTWVFVAGASVGYSFLSGTLVPNLSQDITVVTSAITLLLGGVLSPLSAWLQPRVLNVKKAALTKPTTSVVPTVQRMAATNQQDIGG